MKLTTKPVIACVNEHNGIWPCGYVMSIYSGNTEVFEGEFNQCVDEMSKAEWIKPITLPVYTQEMCDDGTFPSVGMECLMENHHSWDKVIIVHTADDKVCAYSELHKDYYASSYSKFKPLTPPIVLKDGKAYQFVNIEENTIHGIYSEDEHAFRSLNVEWLAQTCTNIQLLGVKS